MKRMPNTSQQIPANAVKHASEDVPCGKLGFDFDAFFQHSDNDCIFICFTLDKSMYLGEREKLVMAVALAEV